MEEFTSRHPIHSPRAGDSTSHIRINAENQDNLNKYLSLLMEGLEENHLMNRQIDPKPLNIIGSQRSKGA